MGVMFVQKFSKLILNLCIKSYGHKTMQRSVLKTLETLKSNLLKLDTLHHSTIPYLTLIQEKNGTFSNGQPSH